MEWRTKKDEDFDVVAEWLLGNINGRNVVLLFGDLGAGKTSFTKRLAKKLLVKEEIISPTFVIQKTFNILNKKFSFEKLIHIDAYRFEDSKEGEVLKLGEVIEEKKNLIVIEWPEKLDQELLKQFEDKTIKLSFEHDGEGRIIKTI